MTAHYDLVVRWAPEYRTNFDAIKRITVPSPDGSYIPLSQVAEVKTVDGPTVVYRQDGYRYTPIKFSVRGRAMGDTVEDCQRQIAKKTVTLNEAKFLRERSELDPDKEEEKAIEKLNENPSGIERDFYLEEVFNIASDYMNQAQVVKAN